MSSAESDTEELVRRAAAGEDDARQQLLTRHRKRLKGMISVRMDRRLASRVDPSDIVQDTLVQADRQLSDYLRDQPLPFYPWIRQLALEELIRQHRRHLRAQARNVRREEQHTLPLPDHSAVELAVRLLANRTDPGDKVVRDELRAKVQAVLAQLAEGDREVLVLRFLEQLSTKESATVLGLTVHGVKARQARALQKFIRLFGEYSAGDQP